MQKGNEHKRPVAITIIGEVVEIVKKRKKTNPRMISFLLGSSVLLPILIGGSLVQVSKEAPFSILGIFVRWISPVGIIIALMVLYLELVFITKFLKVTNATTVLDEKRNFEISEKGTYGTNHFMDQKEREEIFNIGTLKEIKGDFLGVDECNLIYAIKDTYGLNKNMAIFGGPGCGKSRCIVYNMIMQCMRRGESMIAADTKGSVYKELAYLAKKMGYIVKVFNVKANEMMSSDGCDFMATIDGNVLKAQAFANTIIKNTTDGEHGKDFWSESEYNLLTAGILFVCYAPEYEKRRNFVSVQELFVKNTVSKLEDKLGYIVNNELHPASDPFSIYKNADKTVKENTLAGIGIRLKTFNDRTIKKITTENEIDLALPGFKKCAYFVVTDDTDDSMKLLSSMFYTCLYSEVTVAADFQPENKVPIPVNIILDEFKNGGIIPDFDKKIASVRSRGITTTIVLQDLPQLMAMYPNELWRTVLNCCDVQVLLKTNEELTAQHFSQRTGDQTIHVRNLMFEEDITDLLKIKDHSRISNAEGTRPVMTMGETYVIHPDELLVIISQRQAIMLKKFDFAKHPMAQHIQHLRTIDHMPEWRKREIEAGNKFFCLPTKGDNRYEKYRAIYEQDKTQGKQIEGQPDLKNQRNLEVTSFMQSVLDQNYLNNSKSVVRKEETSHHPRNEKKEKEKEKPLDVKPKGRIYRVITSQEE